jgi:retron-type reverse transcriptase
MSKRIFDLYPQVYAFENLYFAEHAAARAKRGRADVATFEYYLEDELLSLQQELREQTYWPGAYRRHVVREPKERLISAAPYRDRVVHHALTRVIEPIFERRFIADSYASRAGKGTHAALDRSQAFARRFPYVLRCDIVQFFPAMDHAVLRGLLASVIGDPGVLWLCDTLLAGGAEELTSQYTYAAFPGDTDEDRTRPRGLPIGNQTSQFWANVYLNALDQFVKRELRCKAYVRYVDDFLLFAPDKPTLHAWRRAIIAHLASLRLTLHEAESVVSPVSTGIPFLGFCIYPDHRRLRHRNIAAFARRYRRLRREYAAGAIPFERLDSAVRGWVAHASHADTFGLRRSLLEPEITAPATRQEA